MIITVSRQSTEWRRRIVMALCRLESAAPRIDEAEEYAFARRLVNALYDRWREPYVVACYYTFGVHPAKLQERLEARRALRQWELYRLVPDYDPLEDPRNANVVSASEVRRPEKSPGRMYEMPAKTVPAKQKPVRRVSGGPKTAHAG